MFSSLNRLMKQVSISPSSFLSDYITTKRLTQNSVTTVLGIVEDLNSKCPRLLRQGAIRQLDTRVVYCVSTKMNCYKISMLTRKK